MVYPLRLPVKDHRDGDGKLEERQESEGLIRSERKRASNPSFRNIPK